MPMTLLDTYVQYNYAPKPDMSYARTDAISVDTKYQETTQVHGRVFQRFSIDNRLYCVPIDDVSA